MKPHRDRVAELAAHASTDAELAELASEGLDRVARREVRRRRGADVLLRDAELELEGSYSPPQK